MPKPSWLLIAALLIAFQTSARDRPFVDEAEPEVNVPEPEPWQEGAVRLPPHPKEEDLVEFEPDVADSPFRYFIDGKNLDIGKDQVIRYTLVLRTPSGVNNISFEGMRCNAWEYKVYAHETGRGEFRRVDSPQWQPVTTGSQDRLHKELHEYFFCVPYQYVPRSRKDILGGLRGNRDLQDAGFYSD